MSYRLKNRDMDSPIPLTFTQPQIPQWKPPPGSFRVVVNAIISVRKANPGITKQFNLSLDPEVVADELDSQHAAKLAAAGHTAYLKEGAATIPFPPEWRPPWSPLQNASAAAAGSQPSTPPSWFKSLGNAATGVKTIASWLGSGGKPVENELAEKRSRICLQCPENKRGDLISFFTKPASELIRRQLQERTELSLSTSNDDQLGVCNICSCPLKLKIHCPVQVIVEHMNQKTIDSLPVFCWIKSEKK